MDGTVYLDEIVQKLTLLDIVFAFPHLETFDSTPTSILGYLSTIFDLWFGKSLTLLSTSTSRWRIDIP